MQVGAHTDVRQPDHTGERRFNPVVLKPDPGCFALGNSDIHRSSQLIHLGLGYAVVGPQAAGPVILPAGVCQLGFNYGQVGSRLAIIQPHQYIALLHLAPGLQIELHYPATDFGGQDHRIHGIQVGNGRYLIPHPAHFRCRDIYRGCRGFVFGFRISRVFQAQIHAGTCHHNSDQHKRHQPLLPHGYLLPVRILLSGLRG